MPTYQYRCLDCSAQHEAVQKFTDDPLTECPDCDGTLRKVFSAVGVVFKGSGFYATDSRAKKSSSSGGDKTEKTQVGTSAKEPASGSGAEKTAAASAKSTPAPASGGAPAA
jgi:putative FmdB family regulatory protein